MDISLQLYSTQHRDGLIELCNHVDRRFLSNRLPMPYTVADAESWISLVAEKEGQSGIYRLICTEDRIIGNISIERKEDVYCRDAEIGYMLLDKYRSQGIVTQAAREICSIAFDELDLLRISGVCYSPNVASKRVMEKVGFVQEGLMRQAVWKNGAVYDLYIMGLLRESFVSNPT